MATIIPPGQPPYELADKNAGIEPPATFRRSHADQQLWAAFDTVVRAQRLGRHKVVMGASAGVVALQIAGPEGVAGIGIMPGPTWIYQLVAIVCLAVAVIVAIRTDQDLLTMEINTLKLKAMLAEATEEAALHPMSMRG